MAAGERQGSGTGRDTGAGSDRFTADLPPGEARPGIEKLRLQLLSGAEAGRVFELPGERAVIGTHESADVRIEDPTVSRFHCEIRLDRGRCEVVDLGSRNGTVVNGLRIQGAELPLLATLRLGNTSLRVEQVPQPAAIDEPRDCAFGPMIGRSRAMRSVFDHLARAAASEATVLLEGETGTGKEVAAELIHQESARRDGPFVIVDCASVPADLLESELFGHQRGSFTGAVRSRVGAFEEAEGGTIFLDEIGELPGALQPKLLRVLERKQVKPIGANQHVTVNVRVVAATNRSLFAEVNDGAFRSDLYFRLAVLTIRLPPLRERPEDIPLLVEHLLGKIGGGEAQDREAVRSPEFLQVLARHPWSGNVRELRNYLERFLAFREVVPGPVPASAAEAGALRSLIDLSRPFRDARDAWNRTLEAEYFRALVEQHGGKVAEVAKAAGMDRVYTYRLLKRLGVDY